MKDFAATVNFIAVAIDLTNQNTNTNMRCVSEYTSWGGRDRNQGRGGRHSNNNRSLARSYSPEEWQNLSAEQRAQIYRTRENQGGRGRSGAGGRGCGRGGRARGRGRYRGHEDNSTQTRQTSVVHTDGGGGDIEVDLRARVSDDVSEITRTTAATNRIEFNNGMTRRQINAIYTSVQRIISQQRSINIVNSDPSSCWAEFDSHADTCGVGKTAYIVEYTNRTVDVGAFSQHF